jgi:Rieske Fe-S protein
MIRTRPSAHVDRRQALRLGFFGALWLATVGVLGSVVPFMQVRKIVGLGVPVNVGPKSDVLSAFRATNDAPILIHAPGGIVAAYRKCMHLGCAVPWSPAEDLFHCPCHQSKYDKHTAVVLDGPAPKPLQLFHISETADGLVVNTNPLEVIDRPQNRWDPAVIEVTDSGV